MTKGPDVDGVHGAVEVNDVWVPPGKYTVMFKECETGTFFGTPKIVLYFTIADSGRYHGVVLPKFYGAISVEKSTSKKAVKFTCGKRSNFIRDFARLFGLPRRLDRIPMTRFSEQPLVAAVRTVKRDYSQRPILDDLRYSVIDRLSK